MKKSVILGVILAILVIGVAAYLIYPIFNVVERDDTLLTDNSSDSNFSNSSDSIGLNNIYEGILVADAHEVSGEVVVVEDNGKKILRFQDLDTINGPDLRIYLSTDTSAEDFVDLGAIKGTKGNVNYEIPEDVDLEKYDTALIWCRAFRVLFSHADLNSS